MSGDEIVVESYGGADIFPTIQYSNIAGCGSSGPDWGLDIALDGGGNIDSDPVFADPNLMNYRLLSSSPCINSGDPNYIIAPGEIDLDGNPRVNGSFVDTGAYEYQNALPVADSGSEQAVYAWINGYAMVFLDGTGSYDDDGDMLEYFWYDGNDLITTGAEPNVLLPVGENVIDLIVNDGIEDSEPNDVVITVIEAIETEAKLTPQSVNRKSKRPHVIGRLELTGQAEEYIDLTEPMVLMPGDIAAERVTILPGKKKGDSITLVGFFDNAALMEAFTEDGDVEVTIAAKLLTGQWVHGRDSVKVK